MERSARLRISARRWPVTTSHVLGLDLTGVRLVVLSAREPGLSDVWARNEHFGLHTALLEAGATIFYSKYRSLTPRKLGSTPLLRTRSSTVRFWRLAAVEERLRVKDLFAK